MTASPNQNKTFNELNIAPKILEILTRHKFFYPTPIQEQSIPSAIAGKDLMGIAQTGTGKTLAFGIPMIQRLAQSQNNMMGLVILPTRELALQVDQALKKILESVPRHRQTMLFSATMPQAIVAIAKSYMSLPLRVEVAPSGTTVKSITQELFFVDNRDKMSLLATILNQYSGSILIFSRTKFGAKKIAHKIKMLGYTADEIHSNRTLNQRLGALEGFKIGRYKILVATDIAARGIDVSGIQLVLNYDLPDNPEDYIHRIGRTARAGRAGHAISFATPDQHGYIKGIERLIKTNLPVSPTPALPRIERPPMSSGNKNTFNQRGQKNNSPYRPRKTQPQTNQSKNSSDKRRVNRSRPNRPSGRRQWSNR